tara:strand:+ start:650 stop:874 length:225 start_codon:yes stop_codon:yes gene_type:complete
MIKNEFINSLNNNQLEGMKQLTMNEINDIINIIGAQSAFEITTLKPDNEKLLKYQKLMGTLVILKTQLKSIESK